MHIALECCVHMSKKKLKIMWKMNHLMMSVNSQVLLTHLEKGRSSATSSIQMQN